MSKQEKILELVSTGDLVLDVAQRDIHSNYFEEASGIRNAGDSFIAQRDFGTVGIIPTPPMRPNAFIAITGASNTSPIIISTANTDGLQSGDTVFISEILGNTAANGTWVAGTVVSNTSFVITGSTGNGGYSSGGIWQSNDTNTARPTISIKKAFIFYDKENGLEYPIIFGIDSSSNSRIYVYDSSAWTELTQFIDCAINDASIGTHDKTVDIGTITENGVSKTLATNEVQYWIAVNTATARLNQSVFIVSNTATNIVTDTVLGSSGLGWLTTDTLKLYRFPCFRFNWTAGNGVSPTINFHFIQDERKLNVLYTDSSEIPVARQAIQIIKRNARNYFWNALTSAYERTLPAGWYCESEHGMLNPYFTQEGSITAGTAAQNSLKYGTIPTINNGSNGAYATFVAAQGSPVNLVTGDKIIIVGSSATAPVDGFWSLTDYGATETYWLDNSTGYSEGTPCATRRYYKVVETNIYDKTSNRNWMSVYTGGFVTSSAKDYYKRFYVTVTYSNYQESDPVYQGFYTPYAFIGTSDTFEKIAFGLSFSLMNKEITSINVYVASANKTIYDAGWKDSPSEYYKAYSLKIQDVPTRPTIEFWQLQNYPYRTKSYFGYTTDIFNSPTVESYSLDGSASILDSLNHAPDPDRSYPTPRFAAITASGDGVVIVLDGGDNSFFIANHNGSGALEDDNFPDVRTSVSGNRLKVDTLGNGTILAIKILSGIIHIIRANVAEMYDLQGVFIKLIKIDCVSKESIHISPYGIVYAGKASINIIPVGGGKIESINPMWDDYYNGSIYVTGTTPFVTDANRALIVGGYDETYQESWFNITVNTATSTEKINFRYKYETGKWKQRSINSSDAIVSFANSTQNKKFYIVTNKSLLEYPNKLGSYVYEDDVKITGSSAQISQSKSVPLDFIVNIAEFDNESDEKILSEFRFNFDGESTDGSGRATIEFYANNETSAFDTQTIRIDEIMEWRAVEPRGELKRLRIRMYLADDVNNKQFDIKKILLKFI